MMYIPTFKNTCECVDLALVEDGRMEFLLSNSTARRLCPLHMSGGCFTQK